MLLVSTEADKGGVGGERSSKLALSCSLSEQREGVVRSVDLVRLEKRDRLLVSEEEEILENEFVASGLEFRTRDNVGGIFDLNEDRTDRS